MILPCKSAYILINLSAKTFYLLNITQYPCLASCNDWYKFETTLSL